MASASQVDEGQGAGCRRRRPKGKAKASASAGGTGPGEAQFCGVVLHWWPPAVSAVGSDGAFP